MLDDAEGTGFVDLDLFGFPWELIDNMFCCQGQPSEWLEENERIGSFSGENHKNAAAVLFQREAAIGSLLLLSM